MAGGVGSRFWPISRLDKPKQFLDFTTDGTSFLRMAYDRMKAIVPDDNILVVSLSRYEEQVREQLPELKEENLLLYFLDIKPINNLHGNESLAGSCCHDKK